MEENLKNRINMDFK